MTTESMKPYPAYKDSGIEWIGEIPEGWDMRKVSRSFALIGSGTTPKSNDDQYYQNGDISWIITGDLNDGLLNDSSKKITSKALEDYSTLKIYPKDTIIVAMYGATIGKICITNFEACTNQACCALSESPYLLNRFTFYWFIANKHNIINMSYGGGQPNISQEIVRSLKITTPSLAEQHIIVTFLDNQTAKIDTLIENKQKQIELLKEERTAIINQAVTKGLNPDVPMRDSGIEWLGEIPEHWEIKPLKYVVLINQNALPENTNENYEIQYIDIGNVGYGILRNPPEKMNFGKAPSRARRIVKSGDTIISTVRTYLKAITYIDFEDENIIASTGFAVISTTNQIDEKYLYFVASSQKFIDTISSLSVGVSYPAISSSQISLIPIWFPHSINEQQKIVQLIETNISNTDRIISQIQQQITLLKEYRTALISEAVTGKIDVRHEKGKELI